jgi:hypothetical protein
MRCRNDTARSMSERVSSGFVSPLRREEYLPMLEIVGLGRSVDCFPLVAEAEDVRPFESHYIRALLSSVQIRPTGGCATRGAPLRVARRILGAVALRNSLPANIPAAARPKRRSSSSLIFRRRSRTSSICNAWKPTEPMDPSPMAPRVGSRIRLKSKSARSNRF